MIRLLPLLLLLTGCALTRTYYGEPLPTDAEILVAHAADGVDLPVIHYQPSGKRRSSRPILLCHGISANARHMDLDAEHSLARWFAARGYETYAMSLRGTYESVLPDDAHRADMEKVTFDTYATLDLPAVLELVKAKSGASEVDYVGHSMGGMVLYAYLARGGTGIHAAVTLGSPVHLRMGYRFDPFIREHGASVLEGVYRVPTETLAPLAAPVSGQVDTLIDELVVNTENVSLATWHKLMVVGTGNIAGGVLRQFQRDIVDDRFESLDGKVDYLEALKKVKTPIFVVAAKMDRIARPDIVKPAFLALGGDKQFLIAGVENGMAMDYGHCDLTVGERAPSELWPLLQAWFEQHP